MRQWICLINMSNRSNGLEIDFAESLWGIGPLIIIIMMVMVGDVRRWMRVCHPHAQIKSKQTRKLYFSIYEFQRETKFVPSNLMKINNFALCARGLSVTAKKSDDRHRHRHVKLSISADRCQRKTTFAYNWWKSFHQWDFIWKYTSAHAKQRGPLACGVEVGRYNKLGIRNDDQKYVEEHPWKNCVWARERKLQKTGTNGTERTRRCALLYMKVLLINSATEECSLLIDSI